MADQKRERVVDDRLVTGPGRHDDGGRRARVQTFFGHLDFGLLDHVTDVDLAGTVVPKHVAEVGFFARKKVADPHFFQGHRQIFFGRRHVELRDAESSAVVQYVSVFVPGNFFVGGRDQL